MDISVAIKLVTKRANINSPPRPPSRLRSVAREIVNSHFEIRILYLAECRGEQALSLFPGAAEARPFHETFRPRGKKRLPDESLSLGNALPSVSVRSTRGRPRGKQPHEAIASNPRGSQHYACPTNRSSHGIARVIPEPAPFPIYIKIIKRFVPCVRQPSATKYPRLELEARA